MAKVQVIGDAVVLTSGLSLKDIKFVEKYRPEALELRDEETKEPVFCMSTGENGSVSKYGVVFSGETRDDDGLATLTMAGWFADGEDVSECVADAVGRQLMLLNQLEERLPEVIQSIKDEREKIMASITIA